MELEPHQNQAPAWAPALSDLQQKEAQMEPQARQKEAQVQQVEAWAAQLAARVR